MLKLRSHRNRAWGQLFAGLAAVSGLADAALAANLPPLRSERPPRFSADVVISLRPDGRPALGVSISLPYDQLQWLRTSRGYAAASEFTVVFEPSHGSAQVGDVWDRALLVADFRSTVSTGISDLERRTFDVPPGAYWVRVGVRDLNTEVASVAQDQLDVPDYSKVLLGLADLELGVMEAGEVFRPVPTRQYGVNVARLASRVALFDRHDGAWPRSYPLRYRILDESGKAVAAGTRIVSLEQSPQSVIVAPDSLGLFLGGYVFEVELGEGRSKWRVERSFEVEESGPPRGSEFARMLEPLSYIADAREIDVLRKLPPEGQAAGWNEFWRRRDPTPETPRNEAMLEFFRRVRHSERHFQTVGPGWRSDMGRIYIKYGEPDQIESRPSSSAESPQEIWYYNRPYRRFVFVDREGFGRFVLLGPSIE